MNFEKSHNLSAAYYRNDSNLIQYKLRIGNDYVKLINEIYLSYYLPIGLRKKIFDILFLTIDSDQNNIDNNWKNFGAGMTEIYKEFDTLLEI